MRGKKGIRRYCWLVAIFLCAAAIAGCSSGREEGVVFDPEGGGHTSSWIFTHPAAAEQDISSCTSCHGDDLGGGISGVSCMTSACHHDPIPDWITSHPVSALAQASSCTVCHGSDLAGGFSDVSCLNSACHHDPVPNWDLPSEHGASAKRAPGASGFESCQICHGKEFTGGVSGVDCFLCHPGSPHPNDWLPGDTLVHTTTNESNAPVCALCHFNEPGFGAHDPVDPPPGSEPGCFNNTLCHGADVGHPEGWGLPAAHGVRAKATPGSSSGFSYCQNCHGTEFTGDIGVSCLNNAACHGAGVQSPHAPNWLPGDTLVHTTTAEGNAPVCGLCHLGGGSLTITPPTPVPPDVTPGCFNSTLCHGGAVAHSVPFLNHPQEAPANFDSSCVNCHAESGTSPVAEAPTCDICHQSGSPLDFGNCTSCHAEPPDGPAGSYPNIAGGHAVHVGLGSGETPVDCGTCHSGIVSGTQDHYDRANARAGKDALRVAPGDVVFNGTYDSPGRSGSFDPALTALSCSNVKCHGAQSTPNWQTGSIDENSEAGCRSCHTAGGSEPNSPVSGRHDKHLFDLGSNGNALCTECHDMLNGTTGANNHFAFLATDTLEGPARDTVEPEGNPGAYNAAGKTCTVTCHGVQHTDFPWEGEALNHAVPFLGTRHTQDSRTTFSSDCAACHDLSPGNPDSVPPTCATCHQEGSPIALTNCTSCHAEPPDGAAYPNIEGRHTGHVDLDSTGTPVDCSTCHSGIVSGTQDHYDRANARAGKDALRGAPGDVVFNGTYDSPGRSGSFDPALTALSCGNVKCHGAQSTPNWQTGSIDENSETGCRACHDIGSGEPNEPASGKHVRHVTGLGAKGNALCTECHDMLNGTTGANNHFAFLSTDNLEGPAADTVEPNGSTTAYDPADKSCTISCHTQSHNKWKWDAPSATHPFGIAWTSPNPDFHGLTAKQDLTACQVCHGTPNTTSFDGGAAGTSCSDCHPQAGAHPIRWFQAPNLDFAGGNYTSSHRNSGNRDVACAICHSVDGSGESPLQGAPSCFSDSFNGAGCHSNGPGQPNHSVPNLDPEHFLATQTDFDTDCSNCHATSGVSPVTAAPTCDSCHVNFAGSSPLVNKDCTSCHAEPPDGSSYPNIEGRHPVHLGLNGGGTPVSCDTCHSGIGSGTLTHYNNAKNPSSPGDVLFNGTYNARSGSSSFSPFTCSDVSCHGGQTSPNWRTGALDVDTDCLSCHQRGNSQFNSYNSGEHGKHENEIPGDFPGIDPFCVACHDTTKLAAHHFTNLATPEMEGPASGTIGGGATFVNSYNPDTTSCLPACHEQETWENN